MSKDTGEILVTKKGELYGARFAFAGMNFMVDPADLPVEEGQCVDICNCDVDYKNNVSRRNGYTRVTSGTYLKNGWSNDTYTYVVANGVICSVEFPVDNIASISAIPGIPVTTGNVEFKQVNDVVTFSDGVIAGILEGRVATLFTNQYFDL